MILLLDSQNQSSYANLLRFLNLAVKLILLFYVGLFLVRHWLPNVNWKVFLHKNAIFTLAFVILIWLDLLIGTMGFLLKIAFFRKLSAYLLPLLMYFYFFTRSLWSPFLSDVKDNIQKNKYEKSKIASMDLDALELRLIQLMSEKIFCDEDLTLTRLASLLGVKQGQLSEYFQRRFGFGFYHFINQHRVNEAKLLLLESPSRSVLSVADAVGFNSKSTFNRVFLEIVGMTPTEFRISGKN
jgi:AraC-like DNA-binding protein